jgi:hypothetical protein
MVRRAEHGDAAARADALAIVAKLDAGEAVVIDRARLGAAMTEAGCSSWQARPVKDGTHASYTLHTDGTFSPVG